MKLTLTLRAAVRNSLMLLAMMLVSRAAAEPVSSPVIVASHPLASEAGAEMLQRGGTAVDAAIAAQMVMTLVEPQSSGIGGGLFLLHYDPRTRGIDNYDGRETAPRSVTPNLFLGSDGKPLGFIEAVVGGRSVGVPGAIAALWLAHRDHGRLPWADLFAPAIRLAREGFTVSPRLAKVIGMVPSLDLVPSTASYFKPGGRALVAGDILKNEALADTLQLIADKGPDGFYKGPVAQAIVDAVAGAPRAAGVLTLHDLQSFRATRRPTLCGTYRDYRICGMRPPSSGGIATLQILKLLERFDMGALEPGSAQATHLFVEAQRLAFADRAAFLGDPAFVPVPVQGLLAWPYLRQRSRLIDPLVARAQAAVLPGDPRGASRVYQRLRIPDHERPSTAHVSVIDGGGRAVSMTTTVEGPFGSHLMAAGFMLNNQLTDFSFRPQADNRRLANAPAAGKRPLSSMSPTLVFDARGRLHAVIGSPGGWRIIPYVSKTLIGLIDWKMDMAGAIGLPNVTSRSGVVELESDRGLEALGAALEAMGHEVKFMDQTSGLNGMRIVEGRVDAAADLRREGAVRLLQ
jgi:gamma-glutamyltranspeptidase/glutathione hydrolase